MSEFVEYLHEIFEPFGAIRSRKMFGGYGIYHKDLMFGLVADDALFLKVDKESIGHFQERGQQPFEYDKNGKVIEMSYYTAPEDIYDDPEEASRWAWMAYDAAVRANKKSRKKPKKNQ
ncbi:MAG: TfoX/Sxy family protein [Arenicella sp.]